MYKKSKWFTFVLVAIAQFMVVLDVAITNVALPTIRHQLHFSASSLQWVVTAYALCFGGFLLLGGRAADLFGRRRMLLMGMSGFTTFSLLIGLSNTSSQLVVLRALQGISAAFMSPAALSIVLVTFKDGLERGKALGYWALIATGGAALGMLLGGVLTEYAGWRWNFFINVPIGAAMVGLISRFVPRHEGEERHMSLDVPGALLITSSLMTQVYVFSQTTQWGWLSSKTLAVLGVAVGLLVAFLVNESRSKRPLVPLSIFKIRNVTGANLIMTMLYASIMGMFFLITLYVQGILRFSPVLTGLGFLPFPIVVGFMSTRIPKLVARYGFRRFLIAGPLIVGSGLLWLGRLPVDGGYALSVLPALILMPLGFGITMMPVIAAATSGVPAHESGLASGLISTSQQMGGALGLAVLSSIAASAAASAAHLQPLAATVHGYRVAFIVDAAVMALASSIAVLVIRQKQSSAVRTAPRAAMQAVTE